MALEAFARVQGAYGNHTRDNSGEPDSESCSQLELAKVVIIWIWMAKEMLKMTSLSLEHLVIVRVATRFAGTPLSKHSFSKKEREIKTKESRAAP